MVSKYRRIFLLGLMAICMMFFLFLIIKSRSGDTIYNIYDNGGEVMGVLGTDDVIIQEFQIEQAESVRLGIYCATYTNTDNNYGYIDFIIENSRGDILLSDKKDVHTIQDNSFVYLELDTSLVEDGMLILKIMPDSLSPETMISFYTTIYDDIEHAMTYNGILQDRELVLKVEYGDSHYQKLYSVVYGIFMICFIILAYLLIADHGKNNANSRNPYWIHILSFVLAVVWILFFNNGFYLIEISVTRLMIVFMVDILCYHLSYYRDMKSMIHKILVVGGGLIAVVLCGIGLTFILWHFGVFHYFSKGMIVFTTGILMIIGLLVLYFVKRIDDVVLLSLVVFIMGTIFAVSYPISTGSSWDDQIHYERSAVLSYGLNQKLSLADQKLIGVAYSGGATALLRDDREEIFKQDIIDAYESHEMSPYILEEMNIGTWIAYIPEAIGLFIGRGLMLPYQYTFVLGRWADVLLYSVLIYLSMKRLKIGKVIIFAISMFPTTLLLMSNYSYDTWGIAIPILAFSHYIGIMQDDSRKFTYKDMLLICILLLIGFSAKQIYFCMVFSLFFIKKDKFEKNGRQIFYIMIIMTAIILASSFILPFLSSGAGGDDMRGGRDVNSGGQVHFILSNPLKYAGILLRFLWFYWSYKNIYGYTTNMADYGSLSIIYPYLIFVLILVLLDKGKDDMNAINMGKRLWVFMIAFLTSVWVATSLYIAYTPVGAETVNGCQARYLLPMVYIVGYHLSDYRLVRIPVKYINQRVLTMLASVGLSIYSLCAIYLQCLSLY